MEWGLGYPHESRWCHVGVESECTLRPSDVLAAPRGINHRLLDKRPDIVLATLSIQPHTLADPPLDTPLFVTTMNLKISNKVKAFLAFRDAKKRGSTAGASEYIWPILWTG